MAGRRGSVLEEDYEETWGWDDLLVTSPPQGSYTMSTERGAALDTQVLLLEQNDMFNHMPLLKYFGFSKLTSQDK